MTTHKHPITVPGPPVTAEVSVPQVVAYLERTGWKPMATRAHRYVKSTSWPEVRVDPNDRYLTVNLSAVVRCVASAERRYPAAVLRDIAATVVVGEDEGR